MKNVKPEDTLDLTKDQMMEWSIEDLEYEFDRVQEKMPRSRVDDIYLIKIISILEETRMKLDTLFN